MQFFKPENYLEVRKALGSRPKISEGSRRFLRIFRVGVVRKPTAAAGSSLHGNRVLVLASFALSFCSEASEAAAIGASGLRLQRMFSTAQHIEQAEEEVPMGMIIQHPIHQTPRLAYDLARDGYHDLNEGLEFQTQQPELVR